MGVKNILAIGEREHQQAGQDGATPARVHRVLVGNIRGQAGKSGIKRGDVVTHVAGEVFTGDATAMNALLMKAYKSRVRMEL